MNQRIAPKTNTPFSRMERLLDIYEFMRRFEELHKFKPTIRDLVEEGFSPSTSVVRYYLDRMERLNMIKTPQIEVVRGGKKRIITPARAIQLLPLSEAHPLVMDLAVKKKLIKKESAHV